MYGQWKKWCPKMSFDKRSTSPALARVDKNAKFYFLHGDDEAAIERAKDQIVATHLSREEREENYFEIVPTGSPPQLRRVLDDVLGELSTVSFLPDVTRIVTLYTVNDFFEGKSGGARRGRGKKAEADDKNKKSPSDHLASFLQAELPNLPALLIVIAVEDYEKFKRVSTSNPVVQFAQSRSAVYCFKEDSPQFLFFDALFARQTTRALELWREWHRRAPGSPRPSMMLASQLRLLIQAKTASSTAVLQQRGVKRTEYGKDFMPHEADKNLFALRPEFRRDKLIRASSAFTFNELLDAYEKLMDIQKYVIPTASDIYVPDRQLLAETWIIDFTLPRNSR